MPTQEQKQEAVGKAATAFAELEQALEADKKCASKIIHALELCYETGVGTQHEFLTISNDIEGLRGDIAKLLANLLRVHKTATKIAQRCECDVPPNYAIDGGVVTPMSGGPR